MRHLVLILGLCLPIGMASAQTFGTIAGEVKDASGAVMPNVPVTARNAGTNATRETTTNDAGVYSFPSLVPGIYSVKASATGFQPTERTNIELQVQQTARIDFSLIVGQATSTVEVSGSGQMLTTENATVGMVIEQKQIVELPLNGRNFLQLVALSPNVTFGFTAAAQAAGRQGGTRADQNISLAGLRGTWNHYTLDGVENTDPNFNLYIQLPSIDAIQEFKVQSGIYPAEFGREAGQINVSTRSGTNNFHGTVFEFLRNDVLDAKPYDFSGTSPAKSPFRFNQYGFTLGGPIWIPKLFNGRNKLFFMSNFEGNKSRTKSYNLYTTAPAAWRSGDFSGFSTPLFDPITRQTAADGTVTQSLFPGNIVPTNRFDPISLKLLQFDPLPNLDVNNVNKPSNNFLNLQAASVDKNQFNQRIDFYESSSSQWFGRYSWTDEFTVIPALPLSGTNLYTTSKQYMASNTRVLSPTKVNEFRFGYSTLYNIFAQELSGKRDVVKELGLPFTVGSGPSWGIPNVGSFINNLSGFGNPTNGPFAIDDKIVQGLDNFSWVHGKHSLRFGAEYRWDVFNQYGNEYARGQFQFNGQYTANANNKAGGNSIADMILGNLSRTDLAVTLAAGDYHANSFAAYLDDAYKVTSNLTVTLGLRYEVVQPWKDYLGNEVNFQFQQPLPLAANVPANQHPVYVRTGSGNFYDGLNFRMAGVLTARDGRLGDRLINTDLNNWAPRLGIAYSPNPKWSFRTGFGVFFSQETSNSRFDLNRGVGGRATQLPDPKAVPNITFTNFYSSAVLPVQLPAAGLAWGVIPDIATPYTMMYLVNIQRQFGQGTTLEAGYNGTLSRKLQAQISANGGVPGITAAQTRVPFPEYPAGIELTEGWGTGSYNSLGVKLSQRFTSGLTTLISYTWSKALDNGSAIRGTSGDQYLENPHCGSCDKGPSVFNTPNRLVTSIVYSLPVGKGKQFLNHGGVLNQVVGGWELSTILTAQSGRPLYGVGWDAAGQIIVPDANRFNSTGISPYLPSDQQDLNHYWNLAAFSNVTAGNFGSLGRNILTGRASWNLDLSAHKSFRITERQSLQFRFETFNTPNHPNFGSPNTNWGSTNQTPAASFGQTRSAATMRQMQVALKYVF
jgi:Carboxypeptidase regulatory-like domain/TonB-dependent Receptor Plug Domain/TonB dependent receptor